MQSIIIVFGLIAGLAACSSSATPAAFPDGWTTTSGKAEMTASHGPQQFALKKVPFSGTIKDFASQLTINTVLANRTAKFVRSVPFPECPGEAGIQTFALGGASPQTLEVGFTVTGNMAITASYARPKGAAADPAAHAAMQKDVCTVVV
ncbi:MAG: hypothetical protein M3R35_00720 [Candidatus Eremiobacteraeota bacterium]|nr:hypothetical protein [Candidatus Eremiobacteraeota bacterium]